jgi:uncharacterized protein (UPF0305 family)
VGVEKVLEFNMAWTRDRTQEWISQLENRLEDIDYYLNQTVEWCETNEIYDDQMVFACAVMTVVWVSHMRGEPLSKREALEIVGVVDAEEVDDDEYSLGEEFQDYDHEELLAAVVSRFY